MNKTLAAILFVCGSGNIQASNAQQFDQLTRPVAMLSDSTQIRAMLDALLIPVPEQINRAEVLDVTLNGFGPNDLVVLHPSMETYEIGNDVPKLLQDSMKSWEITADYRIDATRQEGMRMASDTQARQDARTALTADVLSAVARYYQGDDFDLRMSQDAQGVRLEIWNYDPDAMHLTLPAIPEDTLWQTFRFGIPVVLTAFKDVSDCMQTYVNGGRVHIHPCE